MDYKEKLKEIFSNLMEDGLEGAIPTLIVEVLKCWRAWSSSTIITPT